MTAVNVYWEKAASAATRHLRRKDKKGVVDTWKDDHPSRARGTLQRPRIRCRRHVKERRRRSGPAASDPRLDRRAEAATEKAPPPVKDSDDPGPPTPETRGVADPARERAEEVPPQNRGGDPSPAAAERPAPRACRAGAEARALAVRGR